MPDNDRKNSMSRWARFRAALKIARISAKQWCDEHDLTEGHLYECLNGRRDTASTLALIDAFIANQLGDDVQQAPTSAAPAA